ncbi:helicase-exonuclease AddAB subunit AddA [Waltera intestinalis]|uniref:DNA 3'-5' helicase n=1 Tax=Waltera intestinalis TaxID=2606635 RepID=A0A6L5YJN1_9FIRM|nr:helicase-exonuclease AddAB subunit AddA [Waltera intestinalis]MST58481.1 helicase-exonuclease AddAB subunit AddA [Waltera intestinalis]
MGMKFTPEQQRVIELHNSNILVSAAAGSGKTAVLVERIIRMICDGEHPADIDRLLIVTFTNAAAAEMRERIAAGITARLETDPGNEHIQKQSALLHNAQITTIDSFSLFLIRNHFNEIGLDPDFRVADEGEIKLLQQEVLAQLLEDAYAGQFVPEAPEQFHACVEYFCPGGRESVLEQHILNLSRYAGSFPWPAEWLEERKNDYAAGDMEALVHSDYGQYLTERVNRTVEGCLEKLREVKRLCELPDGPYMYGELTEAEIEQLERLTSCKDLEEQAAKVPTVTFGRLPSKKDDSVDPAKRELAKAIRNSVKDTLSDLSESYFKTPLELAVEQGKACREPLRILLDLVLEFDRRLLAAKQERHLIDFSDMEHYALQILLKREKVEESGGTGTDRTETKYRIVPSDVAMEYRQYFQEILIDEYQDSNLVQEYLLSAISGEEEGRYNRFMVGDVKQSIYKFRLARPELFLEKYDTYQETGDLCRIDLAKNFRSRIQVVDAVNDVFSRIMSREIGGIAYDDKAALYPGAGYPAQEDPAYGSELLLIRKPEKGEREESGIGEQHAEGAGILVDYDNVRQLEALAIAAHIKQLKGSLKVMEKSTGELRPVRYSDMVILLRTTSGWDEEFKKILEQQGIPVYITSKTGYFGALEVQELLQFLRVLDNPRQDIPLFGVMQSVFGGFTQEEIAQIRSGGEGHSRKRMTLYEALKEVAQSGRTEDTELSIKANDFLQRIDHYRNLTPYTSIRDLLQRILDDYDYLNYVTALPTGSKRRANVEMLLTKASAFEKTSYFGLFHFIRYMEQLEKYDVDYGEADTLDENADVVRIMSIHKSKGLEFPVVFVSGLSKRFNMQDANQSLIVDMDLGVAVDYVDSVRRIKNKTLRRAVLSAKMKEDNLAEELRVFYVALTRAREKLILTAVLDKADEKWELAQMTGQERLTYLDFCEAGSYMDFLLPILPKTGIAVKTLRTEDLAAEELGEQLRMGDRREQLRLIACGETPLTGDPEENERKLMHLRERFAYQYPHPGLQKLYTKTTVSELKIAAMAEKDEAAFHTFEEKEVVPYIPGFRREQEKVSGAVRGNAFHRVMELLDFMYVFVESGLFEKCPGDYETYRKRLDAERLKNRLEEFLQRETISLRLTEEYAKAVSLPKILNFLEQELAYRMWRAQEQGLLYREQPFVLGIDAKRLDPDLPEGEKVLIQGIIDVFFIEDGEIVLLDYKTDVIDSLEALWNRYNVQIQYYEEALTKLMQMPVKERILYSFYLEKYE